MEILIVTSNLHKLREFREMFKIFNSCELLSLHQFPQYESPPETGTTFQENALLKARHASNALNKWTLSDDSGLVVPMLKGAPGVFSKRYAGEKATDLDNRQKLLKEMQQLKDFERSAFFECSLSLCGPDGTEKSFSGICEGVILTEERGRNGFGYDSLFLKHDYEKTFAELDESIKNRISHRSKAFEKLSMALENLGMQRQKQNN